MGIDAWIGMVVGLVGIAVAVYFGLVSRRQRKLVYSINPVRARVVTSGQATGLRVSYHDEPLGDADISAVQLAMWNDGNESIRKVNILDDIVVTTKPQVRILEASVRTRSRGVNGFVLLDAADQKAKGRVPVSWDILERNDGASIQLLYLGGPEVEVSVEGVIEGGIGIRRIVTSSSVKSRQEYEKAQRQENLLIALVLVMAVVGTLLRFIAKVDAGNFLLMISAGFVMFVVLLLVFRMRERYSPFGF